MLEPISLPSPSPLLAAAFTVLLLAACPPLTPSEEEVDVAEDDDDSAYDDDDDAVDDDDDTVDDDDDTPQLDDDDGTPPPTIICDPHVEYSCAQGSTSVSLNYDPSNFDSYSCDAGPWAGPEKFVHVTPEFSGEMTASFELEDDPYTFLLTAMPLTTDWGECDPQACIASDSVYFFGNASITFDVVAGQKYAIGLDGDDPLTGGLTHEVQISCPTQ